MPKSSLPVPSNGPRLDARAGPHARTAAAAAPQAAVTADSGVTVTVVDPRYRGRILAVHSGLSAHEARELAAVYRALGYPDTAITVAPPALREAAA